MADPRKQKTHEQATGEPRITILGPITEAYEGDPMALVAELNRLRAGELVAELQYRHHAYMAVSMAMPGIKAEFEEHAAQEAHHADLLANRVHELGGDPVYDPCEVGRLAEELHMKWGSPKTLVEMIKFDYQLERLQIVEYTRLIRQVAFHDPTTRRILEEILADTENHAAEMADLLMPKNP